MDTKKCENCGQEFIARRSDAKFCNSNCRSIFWQNNRGKIEGTDFFRSQLKGVILDNRQFLNKPTSDQSSSQNNKELRLLISAKEKEAQDLEDNKAALIKQLETLKHPFYDITQYWAFIERGKEEERIIQPEKKSNIEGIVNNANAKNSLSREILWALGSDYRNIKKQSDIEVINVSLVEINVKLTLLYPFIEELKRFIVEKKVCNTDSNDDIEINSDIADIHNNTTTNNHKINGKINVSDQSHATAKTSINVNTNIKIISSAFLSEMEYHALNFQGAWNHLFGFPSVNFHCAIHGMSGEGKSTFAIQFAKYLAENFGVVIYVSGEEGFSKTMKDKFVNNNATSENLYLADLRTFQDLVTQVKPNTYNFIFIDSIDNMRIGALELKEIRTTYKNSVIVTISQSTKDGKMRGSYEIIHDSDIAVSVSNGVATTVKNRFLEKGRTYEIFKRTVDPEIKPRNTFSS